MGRNIIAVDMEKEMVEGTIKNLEWSLENPKSTIEVIQGDATNLSKYIAKQYMEKFPE